MSAFYKRNICQNGEKVRHTSYWRWPWLPKIETEKCVRFINTEFSRILFLNMLFLYV